MNPIVNKPPKRTLAYVEEAFRLIKEAPDVIDVLILNKNSIPVKTSLDYETSIQYAGLFGVLADKARNEVKRVDPEDDVLMVRVRSAENEVIVAPDGAITLIAIQTPVDRFME